MSEQIVECFSLSSDAPLAASFPHFLYGDGYYLSKLEGLQPNEEDHGTVLFYEPVRGDIRLGKNIY